MPSLADKSYLAMKFEATAGTPVRPTGFMPLVSESIKSNLNLTADRRLMGRTFKSDELLNAGRSHEGDIVIYADADNLGHLLNMVMTKGTTTGDAVNGYIHPFTIGDSKTYTIEISRGAYAQRYFGVKGEKLALTFVEGKLQATLTIKAMGQVSISNLSAALTGAGMTSLTLAQTYDLKPNAGFVIGDTITVGGVDIVLTGVNADGITLEFASISVTASIGDPVYLKAQTASYASLQDPLYQGNALVGVGVDTAAATTAAASKATATPIYEINYEQMTNLLATPATGSRDPVQLLQQTQEGKMTLSRVFETGIQHEKWLDRVAQAVTMIVSGKKIGSGKELLTLKLYKVKLLNNEEPLEVGSLIFDKQEFEVLYSSADAKAITVDLVNNSASAVYA